MTTTGGIRSHARGRQHIGNNVVRCVARCSPRTVSCAAWKSSDTGAHHGPRRRAGPRPHLQPPRRSRSDGRGPLPTRTSSVRRSIAPRPNSRTRSRRRRSSRPASRSSTCSPVRQGRQDRPLRRRRRRQDRYHQELINNIALKHGGYSVFAASASAPARGTTSGTR
jgi:hypothetical protein